MTELYKKYRPKKFTRMIGQDSAVQVLQKMVVKNRIPHAVLFTGPSGCGKTTAARILAEKAGCDIDNKMDYTEINAADSRGIEMARDLSTRANMSPLKSKSRVWVIDECHQLTKPSQQALLKTLEDPPKTAYFFLCTTEPTKLLKTIITRCTEIKMGLVDDNKLKEIIETVIEKEGHKAWADEELMDALVEAAEGSPRKALVILDQIINLEDNEKLEAIRKSDSKKQAIDLARILMKPKVGWKDITRILSNMEEEAETVRRIVMGYALAILLKVDNPRCAAIINAMRDPIYDSGRTGLAILTECCYDITH